MPPSATEKLSTTPAFDALSAVEAAQVFLDAQHAAIEAVRPASAEIDRGAEAMAAAIRGGRALRYAAAGSSGLMALADASELSGTFGIPAEAVHIYMAGGVPVDAHMPGATEDDTADAKRISNDVVPGDVVIVLSASGTTPYALAVAEAAKKAGATVIAIANNPETPLLIIADIAICLPTTAEVIAGSTRLGAGTAQKAALNLMSSLMGVKLGHVYQGMMVNVLAENSKLETRAAFMVSHIAGVPNNAAKAALGRAGGNAKRAILFARGCPESAADALIKKHNGHLGPCLQSFEPNQNQTD